jgi:hypothetical protein
MCIRVRHLFYKRLSKLLHVLPVLLLFLVGQVQVLAAKTFSEGKPRYTYRSRSRDNSKIVSKISLTEIAAFGISNFMSEIIHDD